MIINPVTTFIMDFAAIIRLTLLFENATIAKGGAIIYKQAKIRNTLHSKI